MSPKKLAAEESAIRTELLESLKAHMEIVRDFGVPTQGGLYLDSIPSRGVFVESQEGVMFRVSNALGRIQASESGARAAAEDQKKLNGGWRDPNLMHALSQIVNCGETRRGIIPDEYIRRMDVAIRFLKRGVGVRLFVFRSAVAEVRGLQEAAFIKRIKRGREAWPPLRYERTPGKARSRAGWYLDEIASSDHLDEQAKERLPLMASPTL